MQVSSPNRSTLHAGYVRRLVGWNEEVSVELVFWFRDTHWPAKVKRQVGYAECLT